MRSWSAGARRTMKRVGHQDAVAGDDGGLRVEFAAQGRGHLEGLQTALEGLGERAVDDALQALLEVVENPQGVSSPAARRTLKQSGWNITMLVGQPPNAEGPALGDSGSLAGLTAQAVLARVAELADALASGASARKGVGVQVPPRARESARPIGAVPLFLRHMSDRRLLRTLRSRDPIPRVSQSFFEWEIEWGSGSRPCTSTAATSTSTSPRSSGRTSSGATTARARSMRSCGGSRSPRT